MLSSAQHFQGALQDRVIKEWKISLRLLKYRRDMAAAAPFLIIHINLKPLSNFEEGNMFRTSQIPN